MNNPFASFKTVYNIPMDMEHPQGSRAALLEWADSKKQLIFVAVILVLAGTFIIGREFGGWLGISYRAPVAVPSGAPHADAVVIWFDGQNIIAERILPPDAGETESALSKKLEILTDKKTVFAEMTSSGPVKISRAEFSEGDVIWIYQRLRTLEETIAKPADPDIAIPLEEMLKDPRERMKADFVVKVGGK